MARRRRGETDAQRIARLRAEGERARRHAEEFEREAARLEREAAREQRRAARAGKPEIKAAKKRLREVDRIGKADLDRAAERMRETARKMREAARYRPERGGLTGAPGPASFFRSIGGRRYVDTRTGEEISRRQRDARVEAAGGRERRPERSTASTREFGEAARLYHAKLAADGVRANLSEIRAGSPEIVREIARRLADLRRAKSWQERKDIIRQMVDDGLVEWDDVRGEISP